MTEAEYVPGSLKSFSCPNCGGTIAIRAVGVTVTAACASCGSTIDVADPQLRIIQKASEAARIRRELLAAFDQFDEIPHPRKMGVYRAVLIAFPNCADEESVKTLSRVQKSLRLTSFVRGRMIGVFHANAPEPGLWNKDFRPLRAPLPLVVIRSLVAADFAFVLRHPLLAPAYFYNFPLDGVRRLAELTMRKA